MTRAHTDRVGAVAVATVAANAANAAGADVAAELRRAGGPLTGPSGDGTELGWTPRQASIAIVAVSSDSIAPSASNVQNS